MAGGNKSESSALLAPVPSSLNLRPSRCQEILVKVALLLNGINVGLNVGLLGPTLPDLAIQTGSALSDMNLVFIFSSISYMAGSLACGLMLGRFEGYLLISLTLILQAGTTAIAPWCTNLTLVTLFISLSYFFSTLTIAGLMYLSFQLEKTWARVITQAVFLLFNLGKTIVPFVVAPFLNTETVTTPTTPSWLERLPLPWRSPATTVQPPNRHSNVGYGYAIVAGFSLFISALYMWVAYLKGFHLWVSPEERKKDKQSDAMPNTSISAATSRVRKVAVLLLFFLMNFLQCGMESVDAGLMMSFLSEYLNRGKEMGVLASSLYQGVKVAACAIVVLTVKCIHPSPLLFMDFTFMIAATTLMASTIQFHIGDGLLWTTFVLLAIGMSNSYATLASWLQTRYSITGAVTGMLTISFGFGSMVIPTLTMALLDDYGPIMFPLVLLGCSVLCFVSYFVTQVLMREGCCPRVDIDKGDVNTVSDVTVEERQPLPEGAICTTLEHNTTCGYDHNQWIPTARSPQIVKPQSYAVPSPNPADHPYPMTRPSAPTEYTILYENNHW